MCEIQLKSTYWMYKFWLKCTKSCILFYSFQPRTDTKPRKLCKFSPKFAHKLCAAQITSPNLDIWLCCWISNRWLFHITHEICYKLIAGKAGGRVASKYSSVYFHKISPLQKCPLFSIHLQKCTLFSILLTKTWNAQLLHRYVLWLNFKTCSVEINCKAHIIH